jgi:general secretion pathway protein I
MGMWNWRQAKGGALLLPCQSGRVHGPQRSNNAAPAGFTLLEVLVAVAIVAIALVPLLRLHLLSLDAIVRAQDLTTAVLLAQGKMATLPGSTLQTGEEDGIFEDPELAKYRWHTTITEHALPPLAPSPGGGPVEEIKIWHIAVTVRWADGLSERHYTLEAYAPQEANATQ